ncbi:MAG: YggT family protein [Acidithiobacillus sp.]|nr:YggT family protein [Acidithiobacillus sp.]
MMLFELYRLIEIALTLLFWAVFIRAILTWVQPDPYNPIVRFLDRVTSPILQPLQRLVPPMGGIDFSPLLALLLIQLAKLLVTRLFFGTL